MSRRTSRWRQATESLSARLLMTVVGLVAVAALLIGVASYFGMRSFLIAQLNDSVRSAAERAASETGAPGDVLDVGTQAPGTLIAFDDPREGVILGDDADSAQEVDQQSLGQLAALKPSEGLQTLPIAEFGDYRVVAAETDRGQLVVGLPLAPVKQTLSRFVGWEFLVSLAALWGAAGTGLVLVMRQLRPLRQVAETAQAATLPLAEGEAEIDDRVPPSVTEGRTEVARVGAALNVLLDRVEVALQARRRSEDHVRQFVADASHELRTPLTTIRGYAELARSRSDDPAAVQLALEKVEAESGRMTRLVEDLLLLARLDSGRPLEMQPVDLPHLLMSAIEDARVLSPDHHWRVDFGDFSAEQLTVLGDEQRLHQVVTNLLTNARKYTPAGTTVTARARPREVVIHDDGPGFPPELANTAFERFTRGDAARTRGGEGGAGLGLSLVAAIIKSHGGTVTLDSAPGDTTFTIKF